jgi:hypothetical protein
VELNTPNPHPSPALMADRPQPVTDFLVANRRPVALALLVLALVAFAGGATLVAKTFRPADKKAADLPAEFAPETGDLLRVGTPEYLLGGLGALTLAGVLGTAGVVSLVSLPKPNTRERDADARRALLLFGGLTGLTLMAVGFAFAVEWFGFLMQWLDTKSPPPGTYRFVLALLAFVLGAGVAFASAQPARADERDRPAVRRLIFGMNLGLSTFLLLVILVVVNILMTVKVPNRLDTTTSGLNTFELSEATREYVAAVGTPFTFTTTFRDDDQYGADVHRLLDAIRALNPAMFTVKYLSRTLDSKKLVEIRSRFPQADFERDGILITAGKDEERSAYIPFTDLFGRSETPSQGGQPRVEFNGEAKVMRDILFLADDKARPVVYFTTGHGEIAVLPAAGPPVGTSRPANTLRATLEKNAIELRPLAFDIATPKVPADAAIVVVADPTIPFSPAEANALRDYLKGTGGQPGKLILAAGPVPTADRKSVQNVGLDGVLAEYGVTLGTKFLLSVPLQPLSFFDTLAIPTQLRDPKSVLARETEVVRDVVMPSAREVIAGAATVPGVNAEPFLATYPGRATWLESEFPVNPSKVFEQLRRDRDLQAAREIEPGGRRVVAAVVSDGGKGKLAVYGSGAMFLDDDPRSPHGAAENAKLMSITVNWLRDQPAVANVVAKTYGYYAPDRTLSVFRAGVLPVAMASLLTAALGVGVWIVRRK